jgi:hypothetical protein
LIIMTKKMICPFLKLKFPFPWRIKLKRSNISQVTPSHYRLFWNKLCNTFSNYYYPMLPKLS